MNNTTLTIRLTLVDCNHIIDVEPIDSHIIRTSLAISKAGAKLIRRYIKTYRVSPCTKSKESALLAREEYYRYIRETMPLIVKFVASNSLDAIIVTHKGFDLADIPYSVSFSIKRISPEVTSSS